MHPTSGWHSVARTERIETVAKSKRIRLPDKGDEPERKLPEVARESYDKATRQVVQELADEPTGEDDPELGPLLVQYDNEKQLADMWDEKRKETSKELLGSMMSQGKKRVRATTDRGERLTGTHVHQDRTRINPDKLKSALGAKLWRKVTSPALDEDKLEKALDAGEVDPNVVAACTEESSTDFIRVNRRRS